MGVPIIAYLFYGFLILIASVGLIICDRVLRHWLAPLLLLVAQLCIAFFALDRYIICQRLDQEGGAIALLDKHYAVYNDGYPPYNLAFYMIGVLTIFIVGYTVPKIRVRSFTMSKTG